MIEWGQLAASLKAVGIPMLAVDALSAAIALQRGFTLITRSIQNFAAAWVRLLNPRVGLQPSRSGMPKALSLPVWLAQQGAHHQPQEGPDMRRLDAQGYGCVLLSVNSDVQIGTQKNADAC